MGKTGNRAMYNAHRGSAASFITAHPGLVIIINAPPLVPEVYYTARSSKLLLYTSQNRNIHKKQCHHAKN